MANKGRVLLVKVSDGGSPTETFLNSCGFKTRSFTINNNEIDVTKPDCDNPGGIVQFDGMYGVQKLSFSGSGEDTADGSAGAIRTAAMLQEYRNVQVIWPGWGTFAGSAMFLSYEGTGETEGNLEFSTEISFLGGWTFTAE